MAKPMTYIPAAQSTFKPPLVANDNAYLGDIVSSDKNDPEKPITSGFYRQEKGTPLVYKYTYHETKIVLEGSLDATDETERTVNAVKGDVLYFQAGSTITFKSDDYALVWYTGQRKEGAA